MPPALAKLLKEQGLLFVAILGGTGIYVIVNGEHELEWEAMALLLVGLVIILFGTLWFHYSEKRKDQTKRVAELEAELKDFRSKSDAITVLTKRDYAAILQDWNKLGEGYLFLYNIEMQSFADSAVIEKTWGGVSKLTNIKGVVLLLPERKVRRWEKVVLRESSENRFFAREENRKFFVYEVPTHGDDVRKPPTDIGLAIYRFGSAPDEGSFYDQVIVFVLSEPFSKLNDPFVEGDEKWWDYHHILGFKDSAQIVQTAANIVSANFNKIHMRDIVRVAADAKPLAKMEPATLFEKLGLDPGRRAEYLPHLADRHLKGYDPLVIPHSSDRVEFAIEYANGDSVQGHYNGGNTQGTERRRAIVCVGGFTETQETRLMELFEHVIEKEDVVQFYYQVSPPAEFMTLSRYMEDMRHVLTYVNQQPLVIKNEIVLIARSINAIVAALVAAQKDFREMLAGVILVAPVFDMIQMIDNYRAATDQSHVTVEKCWRTAPGYTADKWEDPDTNWLEFFGHNVRLTVLADIIRQEGGPNTFALRGFTDAVGTISQKCPVCVLSNPDDPITGSKKAIEALANAASGGGKIMEANFDFVSSSSQHLPPDQIPLDRYPWKFKGEAKEVRDALRKILKKAGLSTKGRVET